MRIAAFAYNFPHKKTQEGLLNLFLAGIKVDCVLAADPVPLNFYQSAIRVAPNGLDYFHPREIADRLGVPYHVVPHNSAECVQIIRENEIDLGVILGARILKKPVIDAFGIGVLNMHPGLLPDNRGLDNLKWAILKGIKQGVSCHLIDHEIDRGKLIMRRTIDVYGDDTLLDVHLRIQNAEQTMMVDSIRTIASGQRDFPEVGVGTYFKAVPEAEEALLLDTFETYKQRYESLPE